MPDVVAPTSSRAVVRPVEGGNNAWCAGCDRHINYRSPLWYKGLTQVICNVYEGGRWVRVEHYHPACYEAAGEPHGWASTTGATGRVVVSAGGAPERGGVDAGESSNPPVAQRGTDARRR